MLDNTEIDTFWNTDLADIEKTFLKLGQKITDLPPILEDSIPPQGSVLLDSVVNLDNYK